MESANLVVLVDDAPLPPEEARAFWARFSAHMEENKGDLAGFAKKEGFASVHPEMRSGRPVLVASHSAAQRAYAKAVDVDRGGSPGSGPIQKNRKHHAKKRGKSGSSR